MTTATSAPTRPKPAISMEMRWIGPDEAQALLGTITKQRSLRRSHLNALAADMEHNRWEDSHQAVALNTNGALCDGQHRLTTIVETGIGQWMWVATGVCEDAMGVIDTAAQRSAADMLKLNDTVDRNHPLVAAVARTAILWDEGHHRKVRANTNGARKVTNSEINEWVTDQLAATADPSVSATPIPGLLPVTQAAADARSWTGITARTAISPSVLAFSLLLTAAADQASAYEFFTRLNVQDFDPDNPDDPIHQLFDREAYALNNPQSKGAEGLRISEHLFLIFTAFNAWRNGEGVKFVSTSSGKVKPTRVLFPKVRNGITIPVTVPDPE